MEIKETIFDQLSVIGIEKLHSQMVVWLFNLLKDLKKDQEINSLINKLFGFNGNPKHIIKYIGTEIKNIDVYIETDTHVLIIENKIKSSEHSNQTTEYIENIIKSGKNPKGCFLTLIGEEAESKLDIWTNISYDDFLNIIKDFDINNEYFKDYLQTINNLTYSLKTFLENYTEYIDIFKNGSLTKKDKLSENLYENKDEVFIYITKNQLETIFQKAFLDELLREVNLIKINSFHIGETHGNAIFQIYYEIPVYIIGKKEYYLGLQLQNNTLKYNLSHNHYLDSSKDDITNEMKENFINTFNSDNLLRFNNPKSKAYISVSKQFEVYLYEKNFNDIVNDIKSEIKNFNKKCKSFIDNKSKIGN